MSELTDYPAPMTKTDAIELQEQPQWKKLVHEMHNVIEAEKEKLLHEEDPRKIVIMQERVKALRFACRFPEHIVDRETDLDEEKSSIITPESGQ